MAEGALFSLATNLLSTLGSLAPMEGHERAHLATGDIEKLKRSVEAIHAVLLDAGKQQEDSAAVKSWIKRVGDALYDADDLFDGILTNFKLKQQKKASKIRNQVQDFFSLSNPLNYAHEVKTRVKALSKSLETVSKDIKMFCFVQSQHEEQISVVTRDSHGWSITDPDDIIGRGEDAKYIADLLLEESNEETNVPVIAVVGIGGMGKTTLAQLVYSGEFVSKNFKTRWWACMSDTDEDTEILRRIYKAMTFGNIHDSNAEQLKHRIKESVRSAGGYLLVIDDVLDEDRTKWLERIKLLHNGCQGSRIIVTTRSPLVARAMKAAKTHILRGLSENESWKLFSKIAFTPEKKDDPIWTSIGEVIMKACLGVPLAITIIARLLHGRSMAEWESFMNEELPKIQLSGNVVMSALKLSYDRLPSYLKPCFAYCALFPKNYVISKQKLLYLWVAQGFISPHEQTVEEKGDAYFEQLLSTSFLSYAGLYDEVGEIEHYKMHDSVHDLAQIIAGDEVAVLTNEHYSIRSLSARHAFFSYDTFQPFETLPQLPSMDCPRLRSCLLMGTSSHRSPVIPRQLAGFRNLRALELSELGIEYVPHYIGDFIFLRYLNLSRNRFESLPDSISKLLNLITLDISWCERLKAWPKNMRRLINLRHLDYSHCPGLKQMPDRFGELTYLQYLSDFKPGGDRSMLEAFSKLTLKGKLRIDFAECHVQDGDECCKLPTTVKMLSVCSYLGACPPRWRDESAAAIVYLELETCENLKRLPALRMLRNLKTLVVKSMKELEYVEEEDAETTSMASFPCLEDLRLVRLPQLKGWSRTGRLEGCVFPELKRLEIVECPGMELWGDGNRGVEWDSLSTLQALEIQPMPTRESLPRCLLQRDVEILDSFPPRKPTLEEINQTSDDGSVECETNVQSCGIPSV